MGVFPILNTPARESCGYSSCEHITVGAYRRDVTRSDSDEESRRIMDSDSGRGSDRDSGSDYGSKV